jgi:hypothetical protein
MIDDIFIVENVIPEKSFADLQGIFLSNNFPVFLEKTSCKCIGDEKDLSPNQTTLDSPQFAHLFVDDYKENSKFSNFPVDVFNEFQKKVGLTKVNLQKCKYNITLARPDMKGLHLMPHIDSFVDGAYTAIFYVNDSDGDTLFFKDKKIAHRVTPKANSMVCFPNSIFHCAELSQKTPYRAVVNYNFQLCDGEKFLQTED